MFWALPLLFAFVFLLPQDVSAQFITASTASTTLTISICGNGIVDDGEQCDEPGDAGLYSLTIVGRECTPSCL